MVPVAKLDSWIVRWGKLERQGERCKFKEAVVFGGRGLALSHLDQALLASISED